MDQHSPNPILPYAMDTDCDSDIRIERFVDGGVTVTIPVVRTPLIDQVLIGGLVFAWVEYGFAGLPPMLSGWTKILPHGLAFWFLIASSVAIFALTGRKSRRKESGRPSVIGISSSSVYVRSAAFFRELECEAPRDDLRGIELVFPARSLSTRPVAVLVHLSGQPPIRFGDSCSSKQVRAIFEELKAAVLRTDRVEPNA